MIDPIPNEFLAIIFVRLVQPDHVRDAEVPEDLDVVLGCVPVLGLTWHLLGVVDGPHECDELARDDPVEVPVLNFLVILVLLGVEILKAVPPQAGRYLQPFKAVIYRALVGAVTVGGVTEGDYLVVVGGEVVVPHRLR